MDSVFWHAACTAVEGRKIPGIQNQASQVEVAA